MSHQRALYYSRCRGNADDGYTRALRWALRRSVPGSLRHSPSFRAQAESCGEMLHFGRWQSLSEGVGDHVVGWAIDKTQGALFNDPANEVVAHVDVLGARVVLMVARERDSCLIVGKESGGRLDRFEELGEEAAQPDGLLHAVRCCYILALSRRERDDLLPLGRP